MKSNHVSFPLLRPIVGLMAAAALMLGAEAGAAEPKAGAPKSLKPVKVEPTVVSATLTEKKASQAPGSVSIIDREEILQMGAENVTQALEESVGLIIATESGRVARPSIRGAGLQHTLVLVDGRRIAPGYRSLSDLNQIPTALVERIEIVRGPSSALFGSDALGGVINIITIKPPKKKAVAGVDMRLGTNTGSGGETAYPQAYVGAPLKPGRFIIGGSLFDRKGWDEDNQTPDDGDKVNQGYITGQGIVDLAPGHAVGFGAEYSHFNQVGMRDLQNMDRERDATDERKGFFFNYNGKLGGKHDIMVQAYQSHYKADIDITPSTNDPLLLTQESNKLTQYEARYTGWLSEKNSITLGAEFREDVRESVNGSKEYDTDNRAAFAQADFTWFEKLNLVAGLRFDEHSEFGSQASPRVAAGYQILPSLRLKAAYGHGFRAPNPYELYVTAYKRRGKDTYLCNPDLDAETADSYEVGLQSRLSLLKGLNMDLTYFRNDIDDLIEAVHKSSTGKGNKEKNVYQYENVSKARTQGVEFAAKLELSEQWILGGNLTYLDAENRDTGRRLKDQPEWKGHAELIWRYSAWGLRSKLGVTWLSGIEDGLGASLDDIQLVDASIIKSLSQGVSLYGGVKNLFDESSDDHNIRPTYVYLGVRWAL